jgi:hypothetical protein
MAVLVAGRLAQSGAVDSLKDKSRNLVQALALSPEHLEVLLIQFYAESNAALQQEIQKLDVCEPEHCRRFPGSIQVAGVEPQIQAQMGSSAHDRSVPVATLAVLLPDESELCDVLRRHLLIQ